MASNQPVLHNLVNANDINERGGVRTLGLSVHSVLEDQDGYGPPTVLFLLVRRLPDLHWLIRNVLIFNEPLVPVLALTRVVPDSPSKSLLHSASHLCPGDAYAMVIALPGGGGDISFAFQKPLRRCETQPGANEWRKERTRTPGDL